MKKILFASLACAAGLVSTAALGAPGEYWEITSKMEMAGMPMVMPATTVKVCIAKGGERDPRHSAPSKDCELSDVKVSGNKSSWKMRCKQNGEIMTGSGEMTGNSDKSEGTLRMSGKSGGQDMAMTFKHQGKRIGGSCEAKT